jgi:hypothetical protein
MAISGTLALIISTVLTVASTAYQVAMAKKAKRRAEAAAEARRGFELPNEGQIQELPLVYGRALVGGTRVFHASSSQYRFVTSNADRVFQAGPPGMPGYSMNYSVFSLFNAGYAASQLVEGSYSVPAQENGYLSRSMTGSKNEFLYFQQAIAVGPIHAVHDIIIDDARYIDDPSLGTYGESESDKVTRVKAALRVNCFYQGGVADSIISANFPEKDSAIFDGIAYASVITRVDRDEPQFSNVPMVQFLVEGRKVRTVTAGVLSTERVYSNNPAWCLLDYLLDQEIGRGVDLDELDLPSFEAAAAICGRIVQENAIVGGKIYQNTDGTRNITLRNLPLYECNIILDPKRPFRENIESILQTMGHARLIWSAGQFRLRLQYPEDNSEIILAETITDDDLVLDQEIEIAWPSATERFNHAIVRFNNEFENFREDSVRWPSKLDASYWRGIGGKRYYTTTSQSFPPENANGTLLNNYGIWGNENSLSVSFNYLFKVDSQQAGTYTIKYGGDDNCTIQIFETKLPGADVLKFSGSTNDWKALGTGTVTLGQSGSTKFYKVLISGTDKGGGEKNRKAIAASIENTNRILWTTKSQTFSDFIEVTYSKNVYDEMLLEDSEYALENEIFTDGITDPYHALAKAEELVRTSRSAFNIRFLYIIKDRYLEPGDIIRLISSQLNLGEVSELYIEVENIKVNENGTCEVEGTRFDYTQLAWNIQDDVYTKAPSLYDKRLFAPSELTYEASDVNVSNSGLLRWYGGSNLGVVTYILYIFVPEVDTFDSDGNPIYRELGRTSSLFFLVPPVSAASAFFGVRAQSSNGALSPMTYLNRSNATLLVHNWYKGVRLEASKSVFTKNAEGVISPATITITAVVVNIPDPVFEWYIDGILSASITNSVVISPPTTERFVRVACILKSANGDVLAFADDIVVYIADGTNGSNGTNGVSAISAYLTNEAINVFAFANGVVSSYTGASGNFVIMSGNSDVSSNFTLSTVNNPQNITINYSDRTYTIIDGLDANEDTATITIRATGSSLFSGVILDKVLTLGKLRGGYEIVTALPAAGDQRRFEGSVVFLTTDDKLYRYNGTAWVASVPTTDLTGFIANSQLQAETITGDKLAANTITAGKIASNAITADKIAAGAITAAKLATGELITNSAQIGNGVITSAKIGDLEVTNAKIANLTVGTEKLGTESINKVTLMTLASAINAPQNEFTHIFNVPFTKTLADSVLKFEASIRFGAFTDAKDLRGTVWITESDNAFSFQWPLLVNGAGGDDLQIPLSFIAYRQGLAQATYNINFIFFCSSGANVVVIGANSAFAIREEKR